MSDTATPVHERSLKELIGATNPDGSVKHLNMILYGEPSIGKTYAFGTIVDWPEEFLPALLIDVDGGVDTLRFKSDIDVSPKINSMSDLTELYNKVAAQPDYYKTIGVDNITELQKIDMKDVMQEAKDTARNPENVDIYVPSQREWGKSSERMRRVIRAFRDLPSHTIVMAHVDEREDSVTKVNGFWPGLPGKLKHELSGFFSVIGYMTIYEENGVMLRQIQFEKSRRVQARDRFQVLPKVMGGIQSDTSTIPDIWRTIKEGGTEPVIESALETSVDETVALLKGATHS